MKMCIYVHINISTGMKTIIASTIKEDTPVDTAQTLELGNKLARCNNSAICVVN